jgi:hypothetical protein
MKRILVMAAIVCSSLMVFQSCSSTRTAGTTPIKRGNITGNWVLNDVTFEGVPAGNVKSMFGESSYKCFVGSTWRLTNSGNGTYILPGGADCAAKTQEIFWSASAADETFQFKKVYEGEKPKNITDGYRLLIASASGDSMVIKSPVEYGTSPAYIVMNFSKAAN